MENILLQILNYLLLVVKTTLSQILLLLGPMLVLALIMNIVSTKLEILGIRIFGKKIYLYGFAWLGVAVHELGHAAFAIIFGHKITRIVLFAPKSDGTLGSVHHQYNNKNIYHNIGNFFIGIGPVILGSIVVSLVVYLFLGFSVPSNFNMNLGKDGVKDLSIIQSNLIQMYDGMLLLIKKVIIEFKTSPLKATIFLFLVFSVGSSITLSKPDITSAKQGLLFFVLVLLLFNLITIWLEHLSTSIIIFATGYMAKLYLTIVFSLILNILFILFMKIIYFFKSLIFQ